MAGVVKTARVSARLACRHAPRYASRRTFRTSSKALEAQNYTMPALSPTMTEGNIASWKIKEGDSFTAGDVILEIETDKATMDVEAQDDGVLFKILQPDGTKGVQVGQRIAVLAEEGDDLGSLEVPAEDKSAVKSEPKEEQQEEQKESASAPAEPESRAQPSQPTQEQSSSSSSTSSEDASTKGMRGEPKKQTYPLFPSVQQILHENGFSNAEADKIPASGPQGRLLKGDVLAYIGRISKDYPASQSERLAKLSHLDLSNIQIAEKPAAKAEEKKSTAAAEPELPTETEVAIPITLSAVIATQKRVQDSLGIFLPLSTFIARASELANEDLPASKHRKPTSNDLFNAVLGLDKVHKSSRGHYIPQITGISPPPVVPVKVAKVDIVDLLAPKVAKPKVGVVPAVVPPAVGISPTGNVFSVTARIGEEERAAEYLERMKLALEKEPGRLVL